MRLAAFSFLEEQTKRHGWVLSRGVLSAGFEFEGARVRLVGPQGIFKPAVLPEMPLTITSVPEVEGRPRPYADELGEDGLLLYKYRGDEAARNHHDNVGLRTAMSRMTPLIYLHGVVPGRYIPIWPVYILGDDPRSLCFTVDLRIALSRTPESHMGVEDEPEVQRAYLVSQTRKRLHQQIFRVRVLRAYDERCAVCRLRHAELLEAAHILPDGHPMGKPVVPNGLALCKLHHGAFDSNILGIRSDLAVELRMDILQEADGPMLRHGLQGFQGRRISIPRPPHLRPNRDFLEERYELFKRAG